MPLPGNLPSQDHRAPRWTWVDSPLESFWTSSGLRTLKAEATSAGSYPKNILRFSHGQGRNHSGKKKNAPTRFAIIPQTCAELRAKGDSTGILTEWHLGGVTVRSPLYFALRLPQPRSPWRRSKPGVTTSGRTGRGGHLPLFGSEPSPGDQPFPPFCLPPPGRGPSPLSRGAQRSPPLPAVSREARTPPPPPELVAL